MPDDDVSGKEVEAVALRRGASFDTQPVFSPDGEWVLFTSDLSGCENLWMLERADPNHLVQVTFEDYHIVTNGGWYPNSSAIVGTKWYSSTRSISAGELWAWQVDASTKDGEGGDDLVGPGTGVRLVGRTGGEASTSQVGPQEPYVSTDGKWLYYTLNTMDGQIWNYNKNIHEGIFEIMRVI